MVPRSALSKGLLYEFFSFMIKVLIKMDKLMNGRVQKLALWCFSAELLTTKAIAIVLT